MTEERFELERYELRERPAYVFRVNRREFIESIGLGLCIAATAQAQQRGAVNTVDARVHFADDGRVTILTGKVEEGQGARTEVALAAAEELGVPVSQLHIVMADTDTT